MYPALATVALLAPWATAFAQQRVVHVMGDDGQAVAFANVTLAGERPKITNEKGEVEIGTAARGSVTLDVRRLGYEPWYGTVRMGDTVTSALVTLHRISRRMFTIKITDSTSGVPAYLRGFYERMLARQRGIGNGLYLTPEEVDRRNPGAASALLQGLNGVSLQRTGTGRTIAMSASGTCQMTVLVDGHRVCPDNGCDAGTPPPAQPSNAPRRGAARTNAPVAQPRDDQFVIIDNVIGANEVAAVELYPRGASIPPSLPATDASCGLVAFWTGGRRAPLSP
jgi:hypothetical protein